MKQFITHASNSLFQIGTIENPYVINATAHYADKQNGGGIVF